MLNQPPLQHYVPVYRKQFRSPSRYQPSRREETFQIGALLFGATAPDAVEPRSEPRARLPAVVGRKVRGVAAWKSGDSSARQNTSSRHAEINEHHLQKNDTIAKLHDSRTTPPPKRQEIPEIPHESTDSVLVQIA